jgi:SAM-dependent methyltransferase
MKILDLGCGTGWLVKELRGRGYDATGIDINLPDKSPEYLKKGDAYMTGFPDDAFDCVACFETIEHFERKVYAEIKRVTKPDGMLILTTPKKRFNWIVDMLSSSGVIDPEVTPHVNVVGPEDIPFNRKEGGSFMVLEWWGVYTVKK